MHPIIKASLIIAFTVVNAALANLTVGACTQTKKFDDHPAMLLGIACVFALNISVFWFIVLCFKSGKACGIKQAHDY